MIDNFGFLEGVPLILEQTLPDKFFGTSTVPTTIHGRAIYHIRMASSDHVFEPPTPQIGLYCFTPSLHLVFTGIICSSMK